jgi:hypothetical protein
MGSGLFSNPPPTNGGSLPQIPIPSFQSIGQDLTSGTRQQGFWEHFWNVFWHSIRDGMVYLATGSGSLIQAFASIIVDVYTTLQAPNTAGFMLLVASLIEDMLQTPVDAQKLQDSFRAGGNRGALVTVGGSFYDNLKGIFQAGGTALPWTATDVPAKQFMGFLLEFAIRSANAEVITKLLPEEFRVGEGFAAYGENFEKTLSLGRLARRAFQPLIQIMVADPLTRQLNAAYTPKQLSEAQYVRAFVRGDIDGATLQQNLAELGYNQQLQATLISENTKSAALHELVNYVRATDPSAAVPTAALQVLGYSATNAQVVWTATLEGLVDPLRKQFLNELTKELRTGEIDYPTASSLLSNLNLFPQEAAWYQQIWQQMLTFPRKRLSESEMERAYLEGVVDLFAMQSYWTRSGYSLQDMQTLQLLLLLKEKGGSKSTSGRVARKVLSEAEIEKAVKAGIITLVQAQAYWTLHGYSAVDVAILSELVGAALGQPITPVAGTPT